MTGLSWGCQTVRQDVNAMAVYRQKGVMRGKEVPRGAEDNHYCRRSPNCPSALLPDKATDVCPCARLRYCSYLAGPVLAPLICGCRLPWCNALLPLTLPLLLLLSNCPTARAHWRATAASYADLTDAYKAAARPLLAQAARGGFPSGNGDSTGEIAPDFAPDYHCFPGKIMNAQPPLTNLQTRDIAVAAASLYAASTS